MTRPAIIDRAILEAALALPPDPERLVDRALAPGAKPAPVVLPVELTGQAVLYVIERAAHLRDHAGELGFPGGKPEPGDADLVATALRELEEELGVGRDQITILGRLGPCPVITGKYLLEPFVGLLAKDATPRVASGELAAVHRLVLDPLVQGAQTIDAVQAEWHGRPVTSVYFPVGENTLYGASAAVAHELIDRLAAALGRPRPSLRFQTVRPWGSRY